MEKVKRYDKNHTRLRTGECQRPNGSYHYSWTDWRGKRHYVYAQTLDELRKKEEEIQRDELDNIKADARNLTLNDMYELWKQLKRGLRDNTFEGYKYVYETFVRDSLGKKRICDIKKSDVKRFYIYLTDNRGLKPATIDGIHTVLHQVFNVACDDDYIRKNPSDNVLRELKLANAFRYQKKRALTKDEQELFLNFLKNNREYRRWYPVFAVMVGTGLRVGEVTGLRWCDVHMDEGYIDVNHTLVYFDHRDGHYRQGCYYCINPPKTPASVRKVPMLKFVKEVFIDQQDLMELFGMRCKVEIDGYTDFVFLNRFGGPLNQSSLNKVIRRIIRDCNDAEIEKNQQPEVLLPNFSCHSLRHTFTTRMCEAGVNIKVMQDVLGHTDITTTLNIYTDATKDMKQKAFTGLDEYFSKEG